ncbi:MAG: transglutaminase-like domain-containing protein [Candidatus Wallbacteria bacterium]|nr:transglutaminase-like domain-containing protein [Candidatus Wallbacteria bacterium]
MFTLFLVQLAACAIYSRTWLVPLLLLIYAGSGMISSGGKTISIRDEVRIALLGALFFLSLSFVSRPHHDYGFFLYRLTQSLAEFLLAAQAFYFHYRSNTDMTLIPPLAGTLVMLHSGNVYIYGPRFLPYRILVLAFVGLLACYTTRTSTGGPAITGKGKRLWLIFLASVLILHGIWGQVVFRHGHLFDRFLLRFFNQPERFSFSTSTEPERLMEQRERYEDMVAVRVISQKSPVYLRGMAYNRLRNPAWKIASRVNTLSPLKAIPPSLRPFASADRNLFLISDPGPSPGPFFEICPSSGMGSGMFTIHNCAAIVAGFQNVVIDSNLIAFSRHIGRVSSYGEIKGKAAANPLSDFDLKLGLEIPDNLNPAIRDLSDRIIENHYSENEKVDAIISFLHTKHEYSLSTNIPRGVNPIEFFLLSDAPAHCEYFASAAAILLRLAGIPSRYVTGFVVNEWNPIGDYWFATNQSAHAWVEFYSSEGHWKLLEATPASGVPSPVIRSDFYYFSDAFFFDFRKALGHLLHLGPGVFDQWFQHFLDRAADWLDSRYRIFLVLTSAAMALAIFLSGLRKLRSRKTKKSSHPLYPLLQGVDRLALRHGFLRADQETILQFSHRISLSGKKFQPFAGWYEEYCVARFGSENTAAYSHLERIKKGCHKAAFCFQK